MMSVRVYLACAKRDLTKAKSLKNYLCESGYKCRLTGEKGAKPDLDAGFSDTIIEADVIVLLYTENSKHSGRLVHDLICSAQCHKPIIVYRLSPLPPSDAMKPAFTQNFHVNVYETTAARAEARLTELIRELTRTGTRRQKVTPKDEADFFKEVTVFSAVQSHFFRRINFTALAALLVIIPTAVYIITEATPGFSDDMVDLQDDVIPAALIQTIETTAEPEPEETTTTDKTLP